MEYKKTIPLKGLVINKSDVEKIAKILFEKREKDGGNIVVGIEFDDNSGIKVRNDLLIFDNDFFYDKDINTIYIKYEKNECTYGIDVLITTEKYLDSEINIITNDIEFFLSTSKLFEDKLISIKKQNILWRVFDNSFVVGTICTILITLVLMYFPSIEPLNRKTIFFVFLPVSICMGGITFVIIRKIRNLFPCIEFNFGNKKLLRRNQIRKAVGWVVGIALSSILIPLLLQYYKIIK